MRIVRDGDAAYRAVYEGHSYRVRQDQKGHYILVKGTRMPCGRYMKQLGGTSGTTTGTSTASRLLDLPDEIWMRILGCIDRKHLRAPFSSCKKLKGVSQRVIEEAFETLHLILEETDLAVIRRTYLEKINASPVLKQWLIEHCQHLLRTVYHGAHLEPQEMTLATCLNQCDQDYYPLFLRAFLNLLGSPEPGAPAPSPAALNHAKESYDACRALCRDLYEGH